MYLWNTEHWLVIIGKDVRTHFLDDITCHYSAWIKIDLYFSLMFIYL